MNILITGGSGYLATALATELINSKHNVTLATREPGRGNVVANNIRYEKFIVDDLRYRSSLLEEIDLVIHCAGLNATDSYKDPARANLVNGSHTEFLVESSAAAGVKRFVYISTAHVYRSPLVGDIDENSPLENTHPYATSHALGEMAISTHKELFTNGAVSFRLSNTFGLPITTDSSGWTLVVNEWCKDAIRTKSINIKSSPNLSRNFIPLQDAAREIVEASIDFEWVPENDCINLGDSESLTLDEVALLIQGQATVDLGIDVKVKKVPAISDLSLLQFNSIYRPMRNHDFKKSVSGLLQKCASDFNSGLTDGI